MGLMPIAYNSILAAPVRMTLFLPEAIAKLEDLGIHSVSDLVEQFDTLPHKTK